MGLLPRAPLPWCWPPQGELEATTHSGPNCSQDRDEPHCSQQVVVGAVLDLRVAPDLHGRVKQHRTPFQQSQKPTKLAKRALHHCISPPCAQADTYERGETQSHSAPLGHKVVCLPAKPELVAACKDPWSVQHYRKQSSAESEVSKMIS